MSPQTEPPSTVNGTPPSIGLTPAEIAAAILPGLAGLIGVGIIAVLMLL